MSESNGNGNGNMRGPRFDNGFSFGQLLTPLTVVAVGALFYSGVFTGRTDTTGTTLTQQVASLRNDLAAQTVDFTAKLAALQLSSDHHFDNIQIAIANLPDVRAEIVQINRRLDANDKRMDAEENRSGALSDRLTQALSIGTNNDRRLDALERAKGK